MNTTSFILARVSPTTAGGSAPGRIQLLPMGEFAARDGRPGNLEGIKASTWKITPESAAALVTRWQSRKTSLVVDYEHQTVNTLENGKPAPAAGWIESLEATPDGIYAAVKWTDAARAYIQNDEYRYISPVFHFDHKTGAVLELKSAALTNFPALDGLDAVTARIEDDTPMKKELSTGLCRLLGLEPDATEDTMLAELQKFPADTSLSAMLTTKDTEIATLRNADPDPTKYVPSDLLAAEREKVVALTTRVAKLEKESGMVAIDAEIQVALKDGRLPPSCEMWAKNTARTNPETIREYIKSAASIAALCGTQTGGTPPAGTPATSLTDEETCAARAAGISEADFIAAKSKEKN